MTHFVSHVEEVTTSPHNELSSQHDLDSKLCLLGMEMMKMIRSPLLSLAPLRDPVAVMAPLRDPVAVLRLLHRRAICKRLAPPSTPTSMARRFSKILECRT